MCIIHDPETSCTSGAVVWPINLSLLCFPKEYRYTSILEDLLQKFIHTIVPNMHIFPFRAQRLILPAVSSSFWLSGPSGSCPQLERSGLSKINTSSWESLPSVDRSVWDYKDSVLFVATLRVVSASELLMFSSFISTVLLKYRSSKLSVFTLVFAFGGHSLKSTSSIPRSCKIFTHMFI